MISLNKIINYNKNDEFAKIIVEYLTSGKNENKNPPYKSIKISSKLKIILLYIIILLIFLKNFV